MFLRRRPPPDRRPDWRDPNMPVLVKTTLGYEEWEPSRVTDGFAQKLKASQRPKYSQDETYNLRRERRY